MKYWYREYGSRVYGSRVYERKKVVVGINNRDISSVEG